MTSLIKELGGLAFVGAGVMELTKGHPLLALMGIFAGLVLYPGWPRTIVTARRLGVGDKRSEWIATAIAIALLLIATSLG